MPITRPNGSDHAYREVMRCFIFCAQSTVSLAKLCMRTLQRFNSASILFTLSSTWSSLLPSAPSSDFATFFIALTFPNFTDAATPTVNLFFGLKPRVAPSREGALDSSAPLPRVRTSFITSLLLRLSLMPQATSSILSLALMRFGLSGWSSGVLSMRAVRSSEYFRSCWTGLTRREGRSHAWVR